MSQAVGLFFETTTTKKFYSLEEEKRIVDDLLIDLRYLLNACCKIDTDIGNDNNSPHHSILNYGISDLTKYFTNTQQDQMAVSQMIANCIEKFEKRLTNVRVTILEQHHQSVFAFMIKADVDLKFKTIPLTLESKIMTTNNVVYLDRVDNAVKKMMN